MAPGGLQLMDGSGHVAVWDAAADCAQEGVICAAVNFRVRRFRVLMRPWLMSETGSQSFLGQVSLSLRRLCSECYAASGVY